MARHSQPKEKKIKILDFGEFTYSWNKNVLEIDFTEMYSCPIEMSYKFLRSMVEYFGTEEIDTDDIREDGCETCDYGSRYGFILHLTSPTKNIPE